MIEVNMPNQEAKKDAGKPEIGLVPMQFVIDVAKIRSYGNKKYKSPDNWKTVEWSRYWDAMMRHLIAAQESDDPLHALDEESGLPHLSHALCNGAFLAEFAAGKVKQVDTKRELKVEPDDDFVFIDFDKGEPLVIPFEGKDKPRYTGKYEFSFYGKDDWVEGFYILDYDIVVDKKGLKMHPNYWRHM